MNGWLGRNVMKIFTAKTSEQCGDSAVCGCALVHVGRAAWSDQSTIHLRRRSRLRPFTRNHPAQFKETGDWTVAQPADAKLRGKWWEIFNDPELNALEEQLDINNQNIKQFFENFMEARAVVREARSQYFPTLTVAPSFTRSRTSGNLNTTPVNTSGTGTAPSPATAKHALLAAARSVLGARPLGQGPQHRAPSPVRRPGQRRRS